MSASGHARLISASWRVASRISSAERPGQIGSPDVPERLAAVPLEHLQHRGDDPARVSAELAHVEQLDRLRAVPELGPQELQMRRRHGDRHRLVALEPGADEVQDAANVLVGVAVEERLMRLRLRQAVFAGGHGYGGSHSRCMTFRAAGPTLSLSTRAGS